MERPTDPRLEAQLQKALGTEPGSPELPDPLLNARLKARLYQVQEAKEAEKQSVRKIPLWYLPALLSIVGNLAFCLAAGLLTSGILQHIILAMALYTSIGSIVLTIAGIHRASWRETLILVLRRRDKNKKGVSLS
ncbi:MAG: hypothetical protein HFE44_10535 [Oscillospiraceae bacterium]|jgi:hypothetical protein|nr:hypothetical protein [Oscillospiraceae bacterium]